MIQTFKAIHRIYAPLIGAVLLVALGTALSFWAFRQIEESGAARARSSVVINSANALLSELRDAETGERGYMLTGEKTYLEPYSAVRNGISDHLKELRRRTSIRDAQKHLDALAPLIAAELAELARDIELRRRHDLAAALFVISSRRGKRLMDSIRAEMSGFIQIEEGVLARRDAEFQSNMRRLLAVIGIASLLVLLLSLLSVHLINREARQRLEHLVFLETQHLLGIQKETNVQLEQANVKAEELNRFKTDLVSVVSHEVNNALSIMKLATVLLEEKLPPEWLKESDRLFDMIRTNIDALSRAVQNLLNMGHLEAGKLAIHFKPTDAAEILRSVFKCMELLCENKKLQVSLKFPDDLQWVRADQASLTLAVSNLLSNAIKYTPENGRIVLGIIAESSRLGYQRIYVQDTGIGVSEEDRIKILSGHYRSESGKKMTPKGFGVGLSLAQLIIEAHDSSIEIEGSPGKGSRFSFLLPTSPRLN
jgi:signal transduction histidine kinase